MSYETTRELLAETRKVRDELSALRYEIARLVGYHEKDGVVPVSKLEALLGGGDDE